MSIWETVGELSPIFMTRLVADRGWSITGGAAHVGRDGVISSQAVEQAIKIIERAVANGRTEAQVYRFPSKICTDRGRAINQREPDWGNTLVGVPRQIYELWQKYFQPQGYKLSAEIVSFADGLPGDIAITLKWD